MLSCKINLIPFNPFGGTVYRCSTEAAITTFKKRLIEAGFNTRVQRTPGNDIAGACGQLAGQFQEIAQGCHQHWLRTGTGRGRRIVPINKEASGT